MPSSGLLVVAAIVALGVTAVAMSVALALLPPLTVALMALAWARIPVVGDGGKASSLAAESVESTPLLLPCLPIKTPFGGVESSETREYAEGRKAGRNHAILLRKAQVANQEAAAFNFMEVLVQFESKGASDAHEHQYDQKRQ